MKYLTLGVIGHVDHGKTTLVKALTGVDTDRLKEEKERGISISLGYAHLAVPSGEIGIVDVPGHEKFIRTMVSGATGMEGVLLVIDINESVKPQTIEHLEIAELLGLKRGIIAVTKCDTAEEERRAEILEDLEILADGTFLEGAPVVFTSAPNKEGFEELENKLEDLLAASSPLEDEGFAYLPIDRAFSMSGFGTVVTGTLRRGAICLGDELEVYPQGIRAGVRELQSHNRKTERAGPGYRTAVNLRGVEKSALGRGDVLATPGTLRPARNLDVQLNMLKSAGEPLKNGQIVRLLFGTSETFPRIHFLDRNKLMPGERAVLQLHHDEPVAVLNQEPFIIRAYSPMRTIGGGRVLGQTDERYKRQNAELIRHLEITADGEQGVRLEEALGRAAAQPSDLRQLAIDLRFSLKELRVKLAEMSAIYIGDHHVVSRDVHEELKQTITEAVARFHEAEPTLSGMTKAQLGATMETRVQSSVLDSAVNSLCEQGACSVEKGFIRLADFDPAGALSESEKALALEIEDALKAGGLKPPNLDALLAGNQDRIRMYRYLVDSHTLVATSPANKQRTLSNTIAFHKDAVKRARAALRAAYPPPAEFSMSQAKDALETSRKFAVPLLEYFDSAGITRRAGDHRTVVDSG